MKRPLASSVFRPTFRWEDQLLLETISTLVDLDGKFTPNAVVDGTTQRLLIWIGRFIELKLALIG